jgi:hypothetical protein
MAIDDKVQVEKTSRKIKTGSFSECYVFATQRDYEAISSNSNSITLECIGYERSWAKVIHVPEQGRDLTYKTWELVLYNYHPED